MSSFLGKLLESGAPWWVVVGLIVFVVGALLLLAILAPGLLRRGAMQNQSVVIKTCSTANPLDRRHRSRPDWTGRGQWRLAQELTLLKSDDDEVYVYDLPPEMP
jgi:hypothetical protein